MKIFLRKIYIPNWPVMICFFGGSLIGVTAYGAGRCGEIMVLLINLTVGYALKYAAKPPVFFKGTIKILREKIIFTVKMMFVFSSLNHFLLEKMETTFIPTKKKIKFESVLFM